MLHCVFYVTHSFPSGFLFGNACGMVRYIFRPPTRLEMNKHRELGAWCFATRRSVNFRNFYYRLKTCILALRSCFLLEPYLWPLYFCYLLNGKIMGIKAIMHLLPEVRSTKNWMEKMFRSLI